MQKIILLFGIALGFQTYGLSYKAHLSEAWYPQNKKVLLKTLEELSDKSFRRFCHPAPFSSVKAIIVPHAGYTYSGHIASSAYKLLEGRTDIDTVFVLGPSHYTSFHGIALPTFVDYQTSLGKCRIDTDTVCSLSKCTNFSFYDGAYYPEHAIETQIPFIQKYLPAAKIVPMVTGHMTAQNVQDVAKSLKTVITDKSIVIVSSDFTHYGEHFNYVPFTKLISSKIYDLDASIIRALEQKNLKKLYSVCNQTGATVCGKNSLAVLMALIDEKCLGDVDPFLIGYDTSAGNRRNPDKSVSYVAMAFERHSENSHLLTPYEQEQLLKVSRAKLSSIFMKKHDTPPVVTTSAMKRSGGVFVSLYTMTDHGKKLRGCMGKVQSDHSIVDLVQSLTNAAALHDYRFNPLRAREVERTIISISVLTEPIKISSHDDIELGEHGVMLRCKNAMSVYLPHVPVKHQWTCEEMLQNLSKKAGLSHNAWKHPETQLYIFKSQEFKER